MATCCNASDPMPFIPMTTLIDNLCTAPPEIDSAFAGTAGVGSRPVTVTLTAPATQGTTVQVTISQGGGTFFGSGIINPGDSSVTIDVPGFGAGSFTGTATATNICGSDSAAVTTIG